MDGEAYFALRTKQLRDNKELRAQFNDPKKRKVYYRFFRRLTKSIYNWDEDKIKRKWCELLLDAGIIAG